jgi:hypothetical protein
VKRRIATTLALALCLPGCGSKAPAGEPVELLTDDAVRGTVNDDGTMGYACWLPVDRSSDELIADPKYGTAIKYGDGTTVPATWPAGFTGRRVGSEVVVLDPNLNVVATTGRRYHVDWVSDAGRQMGEVICPSELEP